MALRPTDTTGYTAIRAKLRDVPQQPLRTVLSTVEQNPNNTDALCLRALRHCRSGFSRCLYPIKRLLPRHIPAPHPVRFGGSFALTILRE